jgi:hypothetical protein
MKTEILEKNNKILKSYENFEVFEILIFFLNFMKTEILEIFLVPQQTERKFVNLSVFKNFIKFKKI